MSELQPIKFEIDLSRGLRRATFSGVITESILLQTYNQLLSDQGYDPTLNDLVDMRDIERLEISAEGVRKLVSIFSNPGMVAANRLAIVAPMSHVFGLSRMYEIMSSETSEQIEVFRDLKEAEEWLGIETADGSEFT